MTAATKSAKLKRSPSPEAAVPIMLFTFVFSLIIDNGFKFMTASMGQALHLSLNQVSLQASLAGILIGIGAVVYAALSDFVPVRTLMLAGITLAIVGSLLGFLGQASWPLVLLGRIVQTAGLAAAETLYVIYVTKQLSEAQQKTYLGFSTAAFQASTLFGALASGFMATYVSWTAMFAIPLILVFAIPIILRTVPADEELQTGKVDWIGLALIAIFASSLIMFMQEFKIVWLAPTLLGIVLFALHVAKSPSALVHPRFFRNGRYIWALVFVFIVYSVQLGFIVLFPAIAPQVHGYKAAGASLLLAPGYVGAILVGVASGKIGQLLSTRKAIYTAAASIVIALLLMGFFMKASPAVFVVSSLLFACGYALMYAPLLSSALAKIPGEQSGIAVGFYNLTVNIAIPLGIAYSAKLADLHLELPGELGSTGGYAAVMFILAAIALVGAIIYVVADTNMARIEKRNRQRRTLQEEK